MTFSVNSVFLLLSLAAAVFSSPLNEFDLVPRALSPAQCSSVVSIVSVMKVYQATSFCESFLSLQTKTASSLTTTTKTVTTTTGTASTSVVFKPGQPPAKARREVEDRNADSYDSLEKRNSLPSYLSVFPSSAVSSACECLSVPTPLTTVKSTATATSTKSVPEPVKTTTVYPCATPIPTFTPTIPYGLATNGPGFSNTLNMNVTSAEACCNLCYFGLTNCVQAWYYFYEGCVVGQADAVGNGVGINDVCPTGQFQGLTYRNDSGADFRSTGDFAGPCGMTYNNL